MSPEEVFRALVALPREAGTPAAEQARMIVTRHLESRGYTVTRHAFSFQPSTLNALPILGAGLGWLALLEVPLLLLNQLPSFLAPVIWLAGSAAVSVLAWGIGSGVEVPGAERRQDANLVATSGAGPVRRWLVAHIDTKAQGHSMAARLVTVWLLVVSTILITILTALRAIGTWTLGSGPVAIVAGLALVAGALAGRGRLRGSSPGARDNGTGLLAALVAAEMRRGDVGYLFTGAEEFGLIGAREWVRSRPDLDSAEVVNLDTLTDRGALYLVCHDSAGRALATHVAGALRGILPGPQVRRLPVGILVDSLPFARAGSPAITIARLDWDDLRRLHTPRDTLEDVGLSTAVTVGKALASLR